MSPGASALPAFEHAEAIRQRIKERGTAATIYDIAELAGVNASTVSRALGKPGRINAATAERVRAAASMLDFRVNAAARTLQTGRTGMLAIVIADITNPVVFDVVRGAEAEAAVAGYTLVVAESQESADKESEAIDRLLPGVDGLVLATTRLSPERIGAIAGRKPVVLINRIVEDLPSLVADVESGVDQLVGHLAELGHTSIAYIGGPPTSWISGRRWEAVLAAAEARGLAAVEIGPHAPTIEGGRDALRRVLASRATAVIGYNDLVAIGVMQAAADRDVAVPRDLSVAGFDDIFGSELIVPALTTVRTDLVAAGRGAATMVLERIGDATRASQHAVLPTSLVVRGSTGTAPAANPTA